MKPKTGRDLFIQIHIDNLFKRGLRWITLLGGFMFIYFSVLDMVSAPEHFSVFLSYRLGIALFLAALSYLSIKLERMPIVLHKAIGLLGIFAAAATLELMIMQLGGHTSDYYVGHVLIVMTVVAFFPSSILYHVFSSLLVYATYLVPILIWDTITEVRPFMTANIFMTAFIMVALAMRLFSWKSLINEIGLQYDLSKEIEGHKLAEEAFRINEERLRLAMEATQQGWFDLNIQTGEVSVSPEYARIIGYEPAEFSTSMQNWMDNIHPEDRDTVVKAFKACLESVKACTMEYRRCTKSGEWKWIRSIGKVIAFDAQNKPLRMTGTHADISELKQAEELLKRSEAFIRDILDNVDEGFIVVDRDLRILSANRAYCQQTGTLVEDIIGQYCYEITHRVIAPCQEYGEDCSVKRVFETGEPCTVFHRHKDDGSNILYVETKALPMRDVSRNVTNVILTIRDITERHLLEAEQLKTQKLEAIGTLAGGIAHDFNNLLQGVFGYISMARLKLDDKEKAQAMLDQAERALNMSVNLTTQLLTFAKGGKPSKKKISLKPVIENSARFALSGSRSDYQLAIAVNLWHAEVDEGQLGQVIQNIVLNASEAMSTGGTVVIGAENIELAAGGNLLLPEGGKFIKIHIQDFGIGISEHYLSKIFDPYFTTKQKGSGLGLATSYSIVRNHGGAIEVMSGIGGSTFSIYLPAAEPDKDIIPSSVVFTGRKGKVLVMDDEEMVRNIVSEMLGSLGHELDSAVDGQEAIDKYAEAMKAGKPFDIVILDLTVKGGMGGEAAIKKIQQIDPEVVAVVSSGYADNPVIADYQTYGFAAFLNKPYRIDALKNCLNGLLGLK